MDGSVAIERNRVALVRIVAALAAMADFALGPDWPEDEPARKVAGEPRKTLPRYLWRAVLRLLRPAESAARRLVIAAARGMTPPPPRFTPSPAPQGVSSRFAEGKSVVPVARWKAGERRDGAEHRGHGRDEAAGDGGGGLAQSPRPRRIALPLFDRLRRVGPRPIASRNLPRICVPGWTARLPVPVRLKPSPDDPINAARLALRLDALARALDDLPRQARRFARWRDRMAVREHGPKGAAVPLGRCRRLSPLRSGRPPGARSQRFGSFPADAREASRSRGGFREVDAILAHAHELALDVLERPDTS